MTTQRWLVAAAVLGAEYLLFSLLFDAHELVPGALDAVGELAPMPLIVGVAFLILRSAAAAEAPAPAPPATTTSMERPRASGALFVAHLFAYGAFVAASFQLRALTPAAGVAPLLVAAALGVLSVLLLAAFAWQGAGFVALARRAAAPVLLGAVVGAAAWGAGQYAKQLWEPLARFTLRPVAALVGALSPDLVVDVERRLVGTARFSVRIDAVCSGYEGMGLVAVLLAAFLWSFRRSLRFPHALALPLLAMAAAFFANVLRISALIYVGTLGSADVAMGGFHSKAGWLLFCAVALSTTWLARRARIFQRHRALADDDENPTAAYVLPLLALVAFALVTGLASDGGLDRLEPVRLAAAVLALFAFRHTWHDARPQPWSPLGPLAGALMFALWMMLDTAPWPASEQIWGELQHLPRWSLALWIAGRVLGSVLVVPVVEELAFRGFLLRRLVSVDFTAVSYRHLTPLAVLVSSLAFGALHERWLAGAMAGVVYAGVAWRTGSLRDAVIAHAVTNALIAVVVLATGRYSLWG